MFFFWCFFSSSVPELRFFSPVFFLCCCCCSGVQTHVEVGREREPRTVEPQRLCEVPGELGPSGATLCHGSVCPVCVGGDVRAERGTRRLIAQRLSQISGACLSPADSLSPPQRSPHQTLPLSDIFTFPHFLPSPTTIFSSCGVTASQEKVRADSRLCLFLRINLAFYRRFINQCP